MCMHTCMSHACVYTCTHVCVCAYLCLSVDVVGCSCSCCFPMSYKPAKYDTEKSVQSLDEFWLCLS